MDSISNLFFDRIYRINGIFLVPHFPEENEEAQSDCVGNKYFIGLAIFSKLASNLHYLFELYRIVLFIAKAIGVSRLSSGKPGEKILKILLILSRKLKLKIESIP